MAVGQQCKAEMMRKSEKGMDGDNIKSKETDKTEGESQGPTGTHRFVIYYLYPDLIFHVLLLLAIPTRSVSHSTQTEGTVELITAKQLRTSPAKLLSILQCFYVKVR